MLTPVRMLARTLLTTQGVDGALNVLDHLDDAKLTYQHFLLATVAILDMDAIESKKARGRGVVAKLLTLATKIETLDVPEDTGLTPGRGALIQAVLQALYNTYGQWSLKNKHVGEADAVVSTVIEMVDDMPDARIVTHTIKLLWVRADEIPLATAATAAATFTNYALARFDTELEVLHAGLNALAAMLAMASTRGRRARIADAVIDAAGRVCLSGVGAQVVGQDHRCGHRLGDGRHTE